MMDMVKKLRDWADRLERVWLEGARELGLLPGTGLGRWGRLLGA